MDSKVTKYIEKQQSPQKEICSKLRKIIIKNLPKTREEMKWGVPSYDNGKYYFVALKDKVNLGFSIKGLSEEELKLFTGRGKTMRNKQIRSLSDIDEKEIIKLLKMVKS